MKNIAKTCPVLYGYLKDFRCDLIYTQSPFVINTDSAKDDDVEVDSLPLR